MISTRLLGRLLQEHEISFLSGVPCSYLNPLINFASNELNYVAACNEAEAVAIAFGARLAGRRSAVLLQNSGIPNALAPLTSLTSICRQGILGFVGYRGQPGRADEPQHRVMGRIGQALLALGDVEVDVLAERAEALEAQLSAALGHVEAGRSAFLLVPEGALQAVALLGPENPGPGPDGAPRGRYEGIARHGGSASASRATMLEILHRYREPDTVLLATTGKTGRELFTIDDHPGNFYMVGAMGCVSSIGLGLALAQPGRNIVAIDGDGALLMRMGNLATNGHYRPKNLLHVLLDNGCHDSTGGQATAGVDWPLLAAACGYPQCVQLSDPEALGAFLRDWQRRPITTFLHLPIQPGSMDDLARPDVSPHQVSERLKSFLTLEVTTDGCA